MAWTFDRVDLNELNERLIACRRDLHRYAELSWLEYRTTVKIIEALDKMGVSYRFGKCIHNDAYRMGVPGDEIHKAAVERAISETGREDLIRQMEYGFTGVIAEIKGALPGPTIGIRVDIDCNDLSESADDDHFPSKAGFASIHDACMHGCAHDGHTAIGLGVVEVLKAYEDRLCGKVYLIFQAAEEGGRGAESIAQSGLMKEIDYMLAAHIGVGAKRTGLFAAATHNHLFSTKFDAHFKGLPAHAGISPELGHNALAAASTAVLNMLAIPRTSAGASRINIGAAEAGPGRNVIPAYAVLKAETRGVTGEINDYMFDKAMRVCEASATMYECEFTRNVMGKTVASNCDKEMIELVSRCAAEMDSIDEIRESMDFGGGEDVTFMMNEVQAHGGLATLMLIGSDLKAPHHNGRFDFDEKVIATGVELFVRSVFAIGEMAAEQK